MKPNESRETRTERLITLAEAYSLDDIYAFGSRATEALEWVRGQRSSLEDSESDLDIGIRPISWATVPVRTKAVLETRLEELFSCRRVDLAVIPEVDAFVAANTLAPAPHHSFPVNSRSSL